jgi:hypothetical protein
MPNSERLDITEEAVAGRSAVLDTARDLQLGTEPTRIDRQLFGNRSGVVGPRGINSYPVSDDLSFVGHIPQTIEYRSRDTVSGNPSLQSDDNANIPSPRAGDALLG